MPFNVRGENLVNLNGPSLDGLGLLVAPLLEEVFDLESLGPVDAQRILAPKLVELLTGLALRPVVRVPALLPALLVVADRDAPLPTAISPLDEVPLAVRPPPSHGGASVRARSRLL